MSFVKIDPDDPRKSGLPKKLSPKMQQALRMVTAGKHPREAAKEVGVSYAYLKNVLSASIGHAEKDRLKSVIDAQFADRMAAEASGGDVQTTSALEVKEAELQAIQELRRIMVTSKSDVARAAAAKELLEISHLKQRLQTLAKPSGDESVALSEKDTADFLKAVEDINAINTAGCPRCGRDRATDEEPPAPNPGSPDGEPVGHLVSEAPEGVAQSEADAPAISDHQGTA